MPSNSPTRMKFRVTFFSAILLTSFGFYGCGSDSSFSSTTTTDPAAATPPVTAPISVSVSAAPLIPVPVVPASTPITAIAAGSAGQVTISSANTLTSGDIVAISGSTNYNGTYNVLTATPPSFTVSAPFVGPLVSSSAAPPVVQQQIVATPVTGIAPSATAGQVTVVANNTLTSGAPIVIAGSSIPVLNGPNTVIAPTPTSFSITTTFVPPPPPPAGTPTPVGPTLGVILTGGGVLPGCTTTTTGSATAITLPSMAAVPSRLTGVAPLAVFFDATGTTATAATPFHNLEYRWGFGESAGPGIGTWGTGSRPGVSSRNTAKGPVAAHVFETPGSYIVNLTATDGTNTVSNSCVQIAVTDPNVIYAGANTTCVNASGSDHTGCPLIPVAYADSAACVTAGRCLTQPDFDAGLATNFGAGKRVLFKGGDTFTASIHTTYSGTGPAQVTSYGSGRAKINGSPGASGFFFVALTASDLRISNLEFDGDLNSNQRWMSFQNTAWSNVLLLGNYVHGYANFLNGVDWAGSGGFGFYVFDNRIEAPQAGSTTDMTLVSQGSIVAIVGNNYSMNAQGQQVVRINESNYFVVSDNNVSGAAGVPGNQKETVAVRSSVTRTSRFGVISSNSISVGPGYVGIFPSSARTSLGVLDVIIEGNYIFGAGSGLETQAIHTNAERITIRNNIIDATDSNMSIGILLRGTNGGFSIPSKDVQVYNNSIYSSKSAGGLGLKGIEVDTDVGTGNAIRNNLVYTSVITGTVISDAGNNATKSNNTGDPAVAPGIVTLNPNWTITSPMTPLTKFQPGVGSYAIDKGAIVPVFSDFFGALRTGLYDLGAVNP